MQGVFLRLPLFLTHHKELPFYMWEINDVPGILYLKNVRQGVAPAHLLFIPIIYALHAG